MTQSNQHSVDALWDNLEQSLLHARTTSELLREIGDRAGIRSAGGNSQQTATAAADETTSVAENSRLEELVARLQQQHAANAELERARQPLLHAWSAPAADGQTRPEAVLKRLPPTERPRFSELFSQLREQLQQLVQAQEKAWHLLHVRAQVVNATLNALTGGTAGGYDASGARSVSTTRPLLQRRC